MPSWANRIVDHGEVAPESLTANPRNWRVHPKAQREALAEVLDRVGWVQRVIVNRTTGLVVDGHLRVALAIQRGEPAIPVEFVELSPEEEALVIASLDPVCGMATTDAGKLADLLAPLELGDGPLGELLGDLAGSSAKGGNTDPDAAPPVQQGGRRMRVRSGDVVELGDHRVICGGAQDPETFARLLGDLEADVVFTDPHYNMAYRSAKLGAIENDDLSDQEFVRLLLASAHGMLGALRAGGSYYICMGADAFAAAVHQLRKLGLPGCPIAWVKPSAGLGQQEYRPRFELILFGYRPPRRKRTWKGGRRESNVWDFDADRPIVAREDGRGMILEFGSGFDTVQVALDRKSAGTVRFSDGRDPTVGRSSNSTGRSLRRPRKSCTSRPSAPTASAA